MDTSQLAGEKQAGANLAGKDQTGAEQERLEATLALDILDTGPEQAYEDAVALAAAICGTPISAATFLDCHRQWFKAKVGLTASETPREQSFCAHVVLGSGMFLVPDALLDERFKNNPLVTGDPGIRFYAGMPLTSPSGLAIGSLCVIDVVPRQLTREQEAALGLLSRQVSTQLRLRAQMKEMNQKLIEKTQLQKELSGSNALFEAFMDNSPMIGYMKDNEGRLIYYNQPFAQRFHITREEWIGKSDFEIWPPAYAARYRTSDVAVLKSGSLAIHDETSPGPDRTTIHWRNYKFPFVDASGERYLAGLSLDTSADKEAENALKRAHQTAHTASERLRDLALTDASTGLYNRRAFDEQLQKAVTVARHYGFEFSLLFVAIDAVGYEGGSGSGKAIEEAMIAIAGPASRAGRSSDTAFRFAEGRLALLLPSTSLAGALCAAARIYHELTRAIPDSRPFTLGIGAASFEAGLEDTSVLIQRAELAAAKALTLRDERVCAYSSALEAGLPNGRT